jgi:hypothetical protein
MQQQHWGQLLIDMESAVRRMRDLTLDPRNQLQNIVVLAITDEKKGMYRPFVQGALGTTLPQFFHIVGYMNTQTGPDGVSTVRHLLIQPWQLYVAKDRTHTLTRAFGPAVPIRDIDHPELGGYNLADLVTVLESRYTTTGGTN